MIKAIVKLRNEEDFPDAVRVARTWDFVHIRRVPGLRLEAETKDIRNLWFLIREWTEGLSIQLPKRLALREWKEIVFLLEENNYNLDGVVLLQKDNDELSVELFQSGTKPDLPTGGQRFHFEWLDEEDWSELLHLMSQWDGVAYHRKDSGWLVVVLDDGGQTNV